jgi:PPOX class probable F420-dependent enzyme
MAQWGEALAAARYVSLETFRRSGVGVRTPIWFAVGPDGVMYVYTLESSGKVKRVRANGRARVAVCSMQGRVTGDWVEASARIVGADEFAVGMRLIDRKYWPWKRLLDLTSSLRPRERVVIAVSPA